MSLARRDFLKGFGGGALLTLSLFAKDVPVRADGCERANGAGSYQVGPFPALDNADSVYLDTELGFDETMVFCKVVTNFTAFRFPTATMGLIDFQPHEFSMDMRSVTIDSLVIKDNLEGPVVNFAGVLRSETRVFSGDRMKTFIEDHVAFGCEAINLSQEASIQVSRKNFPMTAQFDPLKEHAAIFGDQATFAGRLTQGNIIIMA
jgi:hypothetical protein